MGRGGVFSGRPPAAVGRLSPRLPTVQPARITAPAISNMAAKPGRGEKARGGKVRRDSDINIMPSNPDRSWRSSPRTRPLPHRIRETVVNSSNCAPKWVVLQYDESKVKPRSAGASLGRARASAPVPRPMMRLDAVKSKVHLKALKGHCRAHARTAD